MTTVLWIAAGVLGFLILASLIAGYAMVRFSLVRSERRQPNHWIVPMAQEPGITDDDYAAIQAGEAFLKSAPYESVSIRSRDGLTLAGRYYANEKGRGIFLLVHGYRSNGLHDFAAAVGDLYALGFSLLLIDQRTCGFSEGRYILFGAREKFDVIDWVHFCAEHWPDAPVVVDGISLGAATVMMAAGIGYPANVKALIADCGYTTPGAICRKCLKQWYGLPPFPVYYAAKLWVRLLTGVNLDEDSAAVSLGTAYASPSAPPFLLAHGIDDNFVPYAMSVENRAAIPADDSRAEFISVAGAGHGMSYLRDRDTYTAAILRLLEKAGI